MSLVFVYRFTLSSYIKNMLVYDSRGILSNLGEDSIRIFILSVNPATDARQEAVSRTWTSWIHFNTKTILVPNQCFELTRLNHLPLDIHLFSLTCPGAPFVFKKKKNGPKVGSDLVGLAVVSNDKHFATL